MNEHVVSHVSARRRTLHCSWTTQVPLGHDGVRVVVLGVLGCEQKDRLAFGLGVVDSHLDAR